MPDGDRVHATLLFPYNKPYQQICEGHYAPLELSREVLRALRWNVNYYGYAPILVIEQIVAHINQLPHDPLFKIGVDWSSASHSIERIARSGSGHRRAIAIAEHTGKLLLEAFRHDTWSGEPLVEGITRYLKNLYAAEFAGKMSLPQHYNNADQGQIDATLQAMQTHIDQGIDGFAAHIARHHRLTGLRLSPRTVDQEPIDIFSDIELIGT